MTVFASGHSTFGLARRSAFFAIQSMAPCRSSTRKVCRSARARGGVSAAAKRTTSKPSRKACARISVRMSGIEFGIMGNWRLSRHAVGEQRTEARPRLHLHVPFGRGGMLRPRNFAEIVKRGNVRRNSEIAERAFAHSKIAVAIRRGADFAEGGSQGFSAIADQDHIGRALRARAGESLGGLFVHNLARHVLMQRPHGPIDKLQRLGARGRAFRREW